MKRKGIVYLVGAGPGDPGLVTVEGVDCLRRADVVVYDHLVNEHILEYANPKTRKIYVGKKGASHTLEQEEINRLLVDLARRGKIIVRLKGGDPFIFGRGGEEAETLAAAGVPFEIVPGVTSAIAAPAYAGIPLTHRDFTSTVAFVTGHAKEGGSGCERASGFASASEPIGGSGVSGEAAPPIDWSALSRIGTVVFLMGVGNLPFLVLNLIRAGRDPETPVAVIEWGTLPRQRSVTGTLRTIVDEAGRKGIRPPAVTVVGKVVALGKTLSWFEKKPLFGKRILVTRSREQASALSRRLEEEGAEVVEIPTIEIRPPSSWRGLDRAIGSLSRYHRIIFTSVNGVDYFLKRLRDRGRDLRELKGVKIAAIGPATAKAVEEKGIHVDTVAEEFQAEGLVRLLSKQRLKGKRILIPRAKEAREVLVTELRRLGARVDVVEAYRSVVPRVGAALRSCPGDHTGSPLQKLIAEKKIDLITFASSSTVENFVKMIGGGARRASPVFERVRKIPVASIGPITTETAKRHRLNVMIQPRRYTIPALIEAIVDYFSESTGQLRIF